MPNRLARESSPYLLQHAHNPVDWWAWGEEAFLEARRRDVPIFLSIGYSTCYWCHVMERESFEDDATARDLNEHFVPIKLDREERPDVDDIYMAATLVQRGHGGWPMSVFLEPASLRPFYCGTYFPREPAHNLPEFRAVLAGMARAWREQRDAVLAQAEAMAAAVREHLEGREARADLGDAPVTDALSHVLRQFDRAHGGFGPAPKFPQPAILEFLLDVRERAADDATGDAIDIAVRTTLDAMMLGGLRDHLGGGFHRYCVDQSWTVPHFEKMLYDNAMLAGVFAREARRSGDGEYARAAREAIRYVRTRLTGAHGGFLCAQDAETDGREGATYVWSPGQVRAALCPPEVNAIAELRDVANAAADFAARAYGLDGPPNFRDPHHPDEPSAWVPRLHDRPERLAGRFEMSPTDFVERLTRVSAALLESRDRRPQPRTDDKVIAAWNGMMIRALATASADLGEPAFLAAAERAADFVLSRMRAPDGGLLRSHRANVSKIPALLEDYAAMIEGLCAVARAHTGAERARRVGQALDLLAHAKRAFFDDATGLILDTRSAERDLFVRTSTLHDGALPSGFSTMVHALIDLADLTGDDAHATRAAVALESVGARLAASPQSSVNAVRALLRLLLRAEGPAHAERPASVAEARSARPVESQRKTTPSPGVPDVVKVFSPTDRVEIEPGTPVIVELLVQIAEGWHVGAANPGATQAASAMTPFRVDVTGAPDIRCFADYPAGEDFGEGDARVRVYAGSFPLRVVLERSGERRGVPRLVVTYQACSDRSCLAPAQAGLDIEIARE
ncbi:MAG: DUF255 domain-containing protein [Planctomycetota bacterium]|nr:DUF255 domain-containing protein [Planctomycetota bacterium]